MFSYIIHTKYVYLTSRAKKLLYSIYLYSYTISGIRSGVRPVLPSRCIDRVYCNVYKDNE